MDNSVKEKEKQLKQNIHITSITTITNNNNDDDGN